MINILYSLIAVILISLISLIGAFFLPLKDATFKRTIAFLVALATGVLFGDVFLHLIPEMYEEFGLEVKISLFILLGIMIFFSIEKFLKWRHCHEPECPDHPQTLATMNLVGDGIHNFLDGVIVAGSFMASIPLGITTALAVILHEVPQEIGDYGVLLHSGYTKKKALLFNLFSAGTSLLGVGVVALIGTRVENFLIYVLPLTAGGFLYIAGSDLLPELHKDTRTAESINQLLGIVSGIVLMLLMA